MKAPSFAINYGHNGATTSSFISGGDWVAVLGKVETYAPNSTVYVTIQVAPPNPFFMPEVRLIMISSSGTMI